MSPNWHFPQLALPPTGTSPKWHFLQIFSVPLRIWVPQLPLQRQGQAGLGPNRCILIRESWFTCESKIELNHKSKVGESRFTHLLMIGWFYFELKANQSESKITLVRALGSGATEFIRFFFLIFFIFLLIFLFWRHQQISLLAWKMFNG